MLRRTLAEKHEELFLQSELYRLQGELLLSEGAAEAEVEACFHQASRSPSGSRLSHWSCAP